MHKGFQPKNAKVGYVSWREMCAVYKSCAFVTKDPYFGLTMARHAFEDFANA